MEAKTPILELRDLWIRREIPILKGVSWRIDPGQHWVILGPNGSGKTSLLGALTAYMTPTSGEIHVLGKRYGESDWRVLRKAIGLVSSSLRQMLRFDEPALHVVISGKDAIVNYWGEIPEGDRRAGKKLLREVECGELADRPWGYLSQGEQQRVLIGRALMARPRLLILDEPCAGLDMVAREHFLGFLRRLAKRPGAPTLVLVTHHVEEIAPIFSHVLMLREGRVTAAGAKASVLNSKHLSATFGAKIQLKKIRGRFSASAGSGKKSGVL
ncbi:MAG: ABC transporter ATP-binding protein [Deltaproteobacteria bacterium]|nr:ABC transporter ATP-binding protein [Deltaproteobacteria bacterium]